MRLKGSAGAAVKGKGAPWDWRKDFYAIVQHRSGLAKLTSDRPSTAAIGNWGILDVTQRLSEAHGLGSQVTARLFMGRKKTAKSKLDVPLSRKDGPEEVRAQWEALRYRRSSCISSVQCYSHYQTLLLPCLSRSCLMRPNEALLFHLKNHYALVFACREWVDAGSGEAVRQLLTARRGQRPTAWMDFAEAREVMLGWDGYKMMALSYSSGVSLEELRKGLSPMRLEDP